MPRIRTIKPEFWEDEDVGTMTHGARLLFVASWNLADDEGLLRWTPEYLKSSVFMYDEHVTTAVVRAFMDEIEECMLVVPYSGGKSNQKLGWILRFHEHQRINRPSPPKLPPPSLQNKQVIACYAARDRGVCHICGLDVATDPTDSDWADMMPSPDHLIPRKKGGSDYPSNIRISHLSCNKSKGDKSLGEADLFGSVSGSVSSSVSDSLPEGKGKEGKGRDVVRECFKIWKMEFPTIPAAWTQSRKQKLTALYNEQLKSKPDPIAHFRKILNAVKASEHHMSDPMFQTPESLFKNPERRERWSNAAVAGRTTTDQVLLERYGGAR